MLSSATPDRNDPVGSGTPLATLFGHPRGLFYLFFAEMWERFSYFGMRALLILYLIDRWQLADADASAVYGAYTSMAFGAALVGGMLVDRLLGLRRSLLLGGLLIMSGHLLLAVHDTIDGTGTTVGSAFLAGLSLIVIGTGLFKPAVANQVGALYARDDNRRESGFYIFYVGINAGAALAPLVCGYLGQTYGWNWGFGAAAVGMALGLIVILLGKSELPETFVPPVGLRATAATLSLPALGIGIAFLLLCWPKFVGWVMLAALFSGLFVIGRFIATEATAQQRRHLIVALSMIAAAVVFWSLSQQGGSTLNLFAARVVDLSIGPVHMTSAQTQFFAPFFIVVGAPLFAWLWRSLAKVGSEPSSPWKFVLGLAFGGGGFGVLAIAASMTGNNGTVGLNWLVLAYLFHTIGELSLATPGVAAITRFAPIKIAGVVMGLWLFSVSAGNFIGATIAGRGPVNGPSSIDDYATLFGWIALAGFAAAAIMAILAPKLARLSQQSTPARLHIERSAGLSPSSKVE